MAALDRTQQIGNLGSEAAPLTYTVPPSFAFTLLGVFASFDGSSAAGAFLPCVQIVSDSGHVMAQAKGQSVAAGDSADVTFAPFLNDETTTPAGGGIQFDTNPQTGDWLLVTTTGGAQGFTVPGTWTNYPAILSTLENAGTLIDNTGGQGVGVAAISGDAVLASNNGTVFVVGEENGVVQIEAAQIFLNSQTQDVSVGTMELRNGGDGGILIRDSGAGGVTISCNGTGDVTIGASGGGHVFVDLPTVDPGISGALWNDAGTVKVSP